MTDHRRSGHVEPPAPGEASRERTALIGLLDSGVTAITDGAVSSPRSSIPYPALTS